MSIPMTGTSSLFKRLGREIALVNEYAAYVDSNLTSDGAVVFAEYTSAQRDVVNGLDDILASLRSAESSFNASVIDLGQQTAQTMAADDLSVPSMTLPEALAEIKDQMTLGGWAISQPAISAAAVSLPTTNAGDGAQLIVAKRPNGLPLVYAFGETFNAVCVTDYYLDGGGAQGVEQFQLVAETSVDASNYQWPVGSGVDATINAIFGPKSSFVGDSSFEQWTGTALTNWTRISGTWGSTIVKANVTDAQNGFGGLYTVNFVQSADQSEIQQQMQRVSAGSTYAIGFFLKLNSGSGTIRISLRDADEESGTLTQDNGFPASVAWTINSTNFPTGVWTLATGVFFTPTFTPAAGVAVVINVQSSGALDCNLDDLAVVGLDPLYAGGPSYAIFSGYTPFQRDDRFRFTVTADNDATKFSRSLDRFWSLAANNTYLPMTSGTPNVSDALISLS